MFSLTFPTNTYLTQGLLLVPLPVGQEEEEGPHREGHLSHHQPPLPLLRGRELPRVTYELTVLGVTPCPHPLPLLLQRCQLCPCQDPWLLICQEFWLSNQTLLYIILTLTVSHPLLLSLTILPLLHLHHLPLLLLQHLLPHPHHHHLQKMDFLKQMVLSQMHLLLLRKCRQ